MTAPDRRLEELAGAILDGTPVDWPAIESDAAADERAVLEQLRVLATLRTVTRTHEQEIAEPPSWGHLVVFERIGRGASGEVYRARDPRLDREVALKLLPLADAESDASGAIIEEGRLLARVRHPNVVTLYGADRVGNRIGLWMELVKGRTLEQMLRDGHAFTAAEVVRIARDLCEAVAAVHAAGLLHRDVKAENVMIADDGRVVLMDFGTGRDVIRAGDATAAGTPLYLAPEVLSGGGASAASDVYSLGVLLYRLLTRSYPVQATNLAELRRRHAAGERTDLRSARPDLPARLTSVIDRAIDPQPGKRYASIDALAAGLQATPPRTWLTRTAYAAGLLLLVPLIWLGSQLQDGRAPTPVPAGRQAIAVLPFKNLSGEPGSDFFVDGLTDEIIRNLSVIDGLDVRSQTSSFVFKGTQRNLGEVAEQLNVGLVVEGSVLREGNRLRINAQLVSVTDDVPLWSERFERGVEDVFAIQDEISRAIVDRLRLTLGRGQRRYTTNLEAYEIYLRARALVDRRPLGADSARAAELFRQVIAKDETFAPAYAGLVHAYAFLGSNPYNSGVSHEAARAIMRPAAERALELDPLLAEAHAAMAWVYAYELRWQDARAAFRRALDLNPTLTANYASYSHSTLRPLGDLAEAALTLERALTYDPLSPDLRREAAQIHLQAGRFDEAVDSFERVRAIDPDFPLRPHYGRALLHAGRTADAVEILRQGDGAFLAYGLVAAGRRAEAEALVARATGYPFRLALIHAALGDKDRTFAALEQMAATEPWRLASLIVSPELAYLRDDPRLAALRQRINLPR